MRISVRSVFRVYWRHMRRYLGLFVAMCVAAVITEASQVVVPWFYKRLFDVLATTQPLDGPVDVASLRNIILFLIIFQAVRWASRRIYGVLVIMFEPRVMVDLEMSSFAYLIRHSYQFFTDSFVGSLVRRINRLSRSFEQIIDDFFWQYIPIVLTSAGIIAVIFQRSILMGTVVIVWLIAFLVFQYFFARWKLPHDSLRAEQDSVVTGMLSDALTNNVNINVFAGHAHETTLLGAAMKKLQALRIRGWGYGEIADAAQSLFMLALEIGGMIIAVNLWLAGKITVGDFVLFQTYFMTIFDKVWGVGRSIRRTIESLADATEMVEILELPHGIKDVRGAKRLKVRRGHVEFQYVRFGYREDKPALDGFTLDIAPREKVALVGSSGAGKSTIVKILMRMYDVQGGHILIDGQNIAKVTQDSLHEAISFVPQEPILFHRSLAENIRYGRRDASMRQVIDAAKKAHCHEFIMSLPEGYDTYVGERGVKLSGGERQRVAIARAILKDSPVLVLDEATSSLDSESEAMIQDALQQLMKNKTVIVIAHRLSTIMQMDRIVVVDSGRVVDSGTHAELLRRVGLYKTLWEIQAGGFMP